MCAGGEAGAQRDSIVVTAHNDSSSFLFKKPFQVKKFCYATFHRMTYDSLMSSWFLHPAASRRQAYGTGAASRRARPTRPAGGRRRRDRTPAGDGDARACNKAV